MIAVTPMDSAPKPSYASADPLDFEYNRLVCAQNPANEFNTDVTPVHRHHLMILCAFLFIPGTGRGAASQKH